MLTEFEKECASQRKQDMLNLKRVRIFHEGVIMHFTTSGWSGVITVVEERMYGNVWAYHACEKYVREALVENDTEEEQVEAVRQLELDQQSLHKSDD